MSSYDVVNREGINVKNRSDEIKDATEEQKKGAEEIVKSITSVNELSQINAQSANDLYRFSEDISTMSGEIMSKVRSFALEDE